MVEYTETPHWTCPDCGIIYYATWEMRFCPHCRAAKDKMVHDYWTAERKRMDAIAKAIIAKTLGNTAGKAE